MAQSDIQDDLHAGPAILRGQATEPPREDVRELGTAEGLTSQAHLFGALMAGGMLKISGRLLREG